jgi:hypothetical protein
MSMRKFVYELPPLHFYESQPSTVSQFFQAWRYHSCTTTPGSPAAPTSSNWARRYLHLGIIRHVRYTPYAYNYYDYAKRRVRQHLPSSPFPVPVNTSVFPISRFFSFCKPYSGQDIVELPATCCLLPATVEKRSFSKTSLMVTSLMVTFPPSAYFAIIYPDRRMYFGVRTNAGNPR